MVADVYKLLRNHVLTKIDKEILYGKDCVDLSKMIYEKTNRQVSSTTIKRFFGLIKSKFKPSKYTLDSLSEFVGFKDWSDFFNSYDDARYSPSKYDSWVLLKMRFMQITEHCLESLKQKTNYKPEKFVYRSFIDKRFNNLRKSDARATMFVAPDGYGKSTAMIHLAEKIMADTRGEFKNDIVCLIDGGIFFNLYSLNHNIELINQLIDFKIQSSISVYFQQNPEKRKGNLWVLIDSIDEIFFDAERYRHLVENLMRILMAHNNNWFKVILTCRAENLDAFTQALNKNPILKTFWYDVKFFEEKKVDAINIPLFSNKEIKAVLQLNKVEENYKEIFTRYKDVLEIVSHPYSLSLFIGAFKQNENISEIILLNRYTNTKVLSPPYLEEKQLLIRRFMKLCNFGKDSTSVRKDLLLNPKNITPAYQELLSNGTIFEYVLPEDGIISTVYVSFSQEIIFEYFVLSVWSKDKPFTSELFFSIMEFYKHSKYIQCNLLKLFIKKLVHHQNFEVIRQIHNTFKQSTLFENEYSNISGCMPGVVSAIKEAVENHKFAF
ncbi:hypothetical protein OU798_14565 [Prolixibacteraceae bacterium Z1-6]|uniref:NACHT domain-containing protein n=1 Tax=Draconibacterium aestuarii TaxID=2998507 RepID=A0A9X3J7I6_9BACT|nr:hypothetical protein [Prolixibacteraceae bacterium Z1-6]